MCARETSAVFVEGLPPAGNRAKGKPPLGPFGSKMLRFLFLRLKNHPNGFFRMNLEGVSRRSKETPKVWELQTTKTTRKIICFVFLGSGPFAPLALGTEPRITYAKIFSAASDLWFRG